MPLILGTNSIKDTGYDVANSCRFNNNTDQAFMRITPSSAGNRKTWTWSSWIKKTVNGNQQVVFGAGENAGGGESNEMVLYFGDDDKFHFCTGGTCYKITNRVFRDVSAWYHIAVVVDSTDDTAADRIKIYVNGVRETSFGTSSNPDENLDFAVNNTVKHDVSAFPRRPDGEDHFFQGYQAECVLLDGTAAAITNLGEFDENSGIWKPIDVSELTFGTNGFYLDFEASGNLGNDANGGTDLTESGLAAVDQTTDTCTNNFATLNPLIYGTNYTWSEGNLQFAQSSTNWDTAYSSIGVTKGKWYMEFKGKVGAYYDVGVTDVVDPTNNLSVNTGGVAWKSNSEFAQGGNVGGGLPSNITSPASNTYTADDIIGIALDVDNEAVYFAKNGTYEVNSDPTSGATKTGATTLPNSNSTYFFAFAAYKGSAASGTGQVNFGGGSVDAISSGNTDGDGYGNFEYAPPSGYYALNTKNLSEHG